MFVLRARGLAAITRLTVAIVFAGLCCALSGCTSMLHSQVDGVVPEPDVAEVALDGPTAPDASPVDGGVLVRPAGGGVTPLYAIRVDFSSTYNSQPSGGLYRSIGASGQKVRVRYYVDGVDHGALPGSILFEIYTIGTWTRGKSYQYSTTGLVLSKDNSKCGVRFTVYDSRYEYGVADNYFVAGARVSYRDRSWQGLFGSWIRASTRDNRTGVDVRLPAGGKSYDGLVDFGNGIWIGLPPGREPWISLSGMLRPYKNVEVWSGGLEEIELRTLWIYVFKKIIV